MKPLGIPARCQWVIHVTTKPTYKEDIQPAPSVQPAVQTPSTIVPPPQGHVAVIDPHLTTEASGSTTSTETPVIPVRPQVAGMDGPSTPTPSTRQLVSLASPAGSALTDEDQLKLPLTLITNKKTAAKGKGKGKKRAVNEGEVEARAESSHAPKRSKRGCRN
ncbi:hypothetical protein L210DRAFT_3755292 [Boletus edulis BED1]|uniref:Uncharacterized protein n=1 Tax=Boletus edulis BED1 TaxID=1328754 RepID=A0AAD4C7S2_BOLED|nr:hypothetical protein L210DRAFT_3755292 [Boletus edulis BED1]